MSKIIEETLDRESNTSTHPVLYVYKRERILRSMFRQVRYPEKPSTPFSETGIKLYILVHITLRD